MIEEIYELKKKLVTEKKHGLALDIDETLSWTIGYWVEKMSELFGNPENLTPRQLITKYRYTQNVPYWQTDEALAWMEMNRESDELQELLALIVDADKYIKEISMHVEIVAYITTRPSVVKNGTIKWLEKHGFPNASVITRPSYVHHSNGNEWKADVLAFLFPNVEGIIDDNPSLAKFLPDNYQGKIFQYDNESKSRDDLAVFACKDWETVVETIKREFRN